MPILQRDQVDIYYEVTGEGRPFVFLSETACDGEVWKMYPAPEFSRDHRCITLDYRGTGRSGKPSIPYTARMFVAAAVMDHRTSADILAGGIPGARPVVLAGERHSYSFANPDAAHKALRDFP